MEIDEILSHVKRGKGYALEVKFRDGTTEFIRLKDLLRTAPELTEQYLKQVGLESVLERAESLGWFRRESVLWINQLMSVDYYVNIQMISCGHVSSKQVIIPIHNQRLDHARRRLIINGSDLGFSQSEDYK